MNLKISINLLKMANSGIVRIKGKTAEKKGIFIPIEDNDLFVSMDETTGKAKGVFLSLDAWERKERGQYGDTHIVKQDFSKAFNESHTEEQLKAIPILGSAQPIVSKNNVEAINVPSVEVAQENDDLPF